MISKNCLKIKKLMTDRFMSHKLLEQYESYYDIISNNQKNETNNLKKKN